MRFAFKNKIISNLLFNFGVLLAVVTTTLIQARGYLKGFYYGDPFDGRLLIVLHEHWWHFLRGERPFLDTYFFYPYDRGLGYSDTFFLQGFFYSLARLLNFDLVDSWALATISILILSNIGLALLAKLLIQTYLLKLSFIVITGSSFTFFVFLNMHPTVAGYGLVSFLAYFGIKFFSLKSSNFDRNKGLFGLALTFPLLLLSAWYAAFFSTVYIFLFIVFKLFHDRLSSSHYTVSFLNLFKNLNKINIIFSSVFFTSLASLWVYIYLPVASNVDRDVQELREGSPKFEQLANGSALDGGVFKNVYSFFNYKNFDTLIQDKNGITLSLFVIWITIGIFLLFPSFRKIPASSWISHVWFISSLQLLLFLQFEDFSIFEILWTLFSPLGSIRVPARMLILLAAVLILLVHSALDNLIIGKTGSRKIVTAFFAFLVLITIFIDQFRFNNVTWQKDNYINDNYFDKIVLAQNICDSFYLNSEGEEWWNDQLDAMVLSARLNFPTVNGYSGGYPDNFPTQDWRSKTQLLPVIKWLNDYEKLTKTCLIKANSIEKLDSKTLFSTLEGFDLMESLDKDRWWWSSSNTGVISVINLTQTAIRGNLIFTLEMPNCQNQTKVRITNLATNKIILFNSKKKRNTFSLPIYLPAIDEVRIKIQSLNPSCEVEGDSRTLFFSVKNPIIETS
jgi:hypothetical protein